MVLFSEKANPLPVGDSTGRDSSHSPGSRGGRGPRAGPVLEFGFRGTNRSWEDTFVHFKLAPAPWVLDSSPPQGWLSGSTAMDEKRD